MRAVKTVAVHDKIPLRSIIQMTRLNVDPEYDSWSALMGLAASIPSMPERIRVRIKEALALVAQRYKTSPFNAKLYPVLVQKIIKDSAVFEKSKAIRSGELKQARVLSCSSDSNLLLRGFYQNIFAALAGDSSDIEIKYLALGLSYADTNFTQTTLGAEHYRDVPDETYEDGTRTFYATLYLKKSEGNPPSTTLTAGTSNTVTLTDVTDFVENGRIQIETDNATYNCTVTDITGSVLTVGSITGNGLVGAAAFPDGDIPASGNTCKALISEGAIIVGTDATTTLETGTALNRRRVEEEKTTSDSLLFDYILSGTSVEV